MVHVPLMFLSEWREFPSAPCRGEKIDGSSRRDVVEIAPVAWHASFQPLLQEKTCSSVHEQTPLSNDTIDSVLRHREVGQAKDLSAPPRMLIVRTWVEPFVKQSTIEIAPTGNGCIDQRAVTWGPRFVLGWAITWFRNYRTRELYKLLLLRRSV